MSENHGAPANTSNTFSIMGIVFGAVAVLFLPIIFGPVGIVMGAIGMSKKERLGVVGLVVSIVGTILGFILGALVFASSLSN
jgi:hypothetical protein